MVTCMLQKKKKRNQIVSHRNSRKREWKSAILACHIFSRSPGLQVSGPRRVHLISHCNCTARQRWHSLEGSEKKRRERHIQGYTVNTVAEFCKYYSLFPQGNGEAVRRQIWRTPKTEKIFIVSSFLVKSSCFLFFWFCHVNSVSFQDRSVSAARATFVRHGRHTHASLSFSSRPKADWRLSHTCRASWVFLDMVRLSLNVTVNKKPCCSLL